MSMSTIARTTISLPAPLMRALKEEAADRHMSLSALIAEKAIRERPRPDWYGTATSLGPNASLEVEETLKEHFAEPDRR